MDCKIRDHFLVIGQFLGIALCCYPGNIGYRAEYSYLLISLVGVIGGVITLFYNKIGNFKVYPQLKPNATLITSGPYTFVRHPMYLFLIVTMLGVTLFNLQARTLIGLVLLVITVSGKAAIEEVDLAEKFSEYRKYMHRTKRIIPWVW